jgi:cell division protease FtsH
LVDDVIIGTNTVRGEIEPEAVKEAVPAERLKELDPEPLPFITVRVDDPELISDLENSGIDFRGAVSSGWLSTLLSWVVPVALFFLLWTFLIRKMGAGGGMMQIGKSKAKVYIEKKTGVTFDDVEGIEEAEQELMEVVEFLKNPQKYKRLGAIFPRASCLWGLQVPGRPC